VAPAPAAAAPLAPTTRRIWTWHRLHGDSPAYNVVRVLSIAGRPQPAALRSALADLSARHEALRCAVVEPRSGRPEVVVGEPVPVPLTVEVVRPTGGDPAAGVDEALYRVANRPFQMDTPPLWRVGLVYAPANGRTFLILVMHHLISDLRTSDVVLAELAEAYRARVDGTAARLDGPAPSLLGHLAHESGLVGTPRWAEHLAWWTARLSRASAEVPAHLSAADRDERDHAAVTHTFDLPADRSDAIDRAFRERRLTPALFFLTAAGSVLAAWSGSDRPEVLGLPSVRISRPEDERLVGFLLDTLLLPVTIDRQRSFRHAYRTVRDAFADATDHALPAFDSIVDQLRLPRTGGTRSPLIRLWFSDLTQAATPPVFGDLEVVEYDLAPAWALFDLSLYLRRSPAGYRLHLTTPRGLYEPGDTAALLEQIGRTVVRAAAGPDRPVAELLEPPATDEPPPSVVDVDVLYTVDLLRRHARERSTAVAVSDRDGPLDYRSLDAQVDELAARLSAEVGADAAVGLPARRDRLFLIRLLACWRAGVTAVLLDASWPPWRQRRALQVAAVTYAFPWTGDGPAAAVPGASRTAGPGGGPAHVLFTSGTTGDPLPVRVATRVTESVLADLAGPLGLHAGDRVAMLSGPAHDPVLRDLGLALRSGGTVCIPPPWIVGNPALIASWLRRERVSVLSATPAMLSLAFGAGRETLPDLRVVICGGSPLSAATAALIRSRATGAVVVNGYGCTETPQLVTAHLIAPGEPVPPTAQVPVGQPLPGRRVEVRAADGRRCDVGQLGEVWVAAPHIALGYLGTGGPDRFVVDTDGVEWLRTGDLVRRDAAGRLHLAGRTDRQVLVNGVRVTLEELESVARGCTGVTDAVAEIVGDSGRQAVRVWVQRSAGVPVEADAVRAHLAAALPAGVVPARVIVVDRLELTDNLKPFAPEREPASADPLAGAPADDGLRQLAESVLGRPLDPAANFFDAGFTSVTLLQLSAELSDMLRRPVDALSLFHHPNLRALSAFLIGAPVDQPPVSPEPAVSFADRSDRLARMRASRREVRARIRESVADPPAGPV
jgi:non-ribosomal peptide synthetase component F